MKCVDCGFLGVRDEHDGHTIEATKQHRVNGGRKVSGRFQPSQFVCLKGQKDFFHGKALTGTSAIAEASEQIDCDAFMKWCPGRTPKEHEEMSFLQEMDARTRLWRDEDQRISSKRHWQTLTASVACAIISSGIFSGIFAAIAAHQEPVVAPDDPPSVEGLSDAVPELP